MVEVLKMLFFWFAFFFPQLPFHGVICWMFYFSLFSQQLTFLWYTVGVAVVLQMILLPRGESGAWDIARGRHSLCSHHHLCHHHLCHHHLHHLHQNHRYYRHYNSHDLLANGESGAWDIARGRHSLCSHHHHCHHHLCHLYHRHDLLVNGGSGAWDVARRQKWSR